MTDQRNLILAIVLSILILLGFQWFYEAPRQAQQQAQQAQQQATEAPTPGASGQAAAPAGAPAAFAPRPRAEVLAASERVRIDTPRLHGSISATGGRIDDLTLADYKETTEPGSPEVTLLSPSGTEHPYYADFGWVPAGGSAAPALPGPETRWTVQGGPLGPERPVTMTWDNGQGLVFERTVSVDRNFMFTVVQRVRNTGGQPVALHPYSLVSRHGTPHTSGYYILHEGPLGVIGGTLREVKYNDLAAKEAPQPAETTGGWIGITDKYWLVSLVPPQDQPSTLRFVHSQRDGTDRYQVDMLGQATTVQPGATAEFTTRVFAGAKEVRLLDAYGDQLGIPNFDKAVDFGWFYWLTKPFFYALDYLARLFGNFGIAILVFTVFVKAVFFPLANKSYRAMSRMKALQPQMKELQERYADNRERMSQELMALYKREKVNPVSGCLPIVIQIPVFFALYKVLFVTIEMRHAPFFGWIHDLSAPDPTSIWNLFGLLPWGTGPAMIAIGLWPLIMGVTMWLQQKMNPAPPDPIQARVFMLLPIMFTFMLASFPAGLVIYWSWNNLLSVAQQWLIMRREGARTARAAT
ncbi:membrane protein insertase YidC [Arenibaculum pallidiluteum]|uniref:membrane protein insertase YidC n=1 Tax=Arenibaculum pallidiluteum TaxID=2812559 RepID=UPI001A9674CE|nr:membrane protein insertase YidC [Arenibaculum pallidiluteum]